VFDWLTWLAYNHLFFELVSSTPRPPLRHFLKHVVGMLQLNDVHGEGGNPSIVRTRVGKLISVWMTSPGQAPIHLEGTKQAKIDSRKLGLRLST